MVSPWSGYTWKRENKNKDALERLFSNYSNKRKNGYVGLGCTTQKGSYSVRKLMYREVTKKLQAYRWTHTVGIPDFDVRVLPGIVITYVLWGVTEFWQR